MILSSSSSFFSLSRDLPTTSIQSKPFLNTTMSWLARSIANALRIDDDGNDEAETHSRYESATSSPTIIQSESQNDAAVHQRRLNGDDEKRESDYDDDEARCGDRGVKEDISEFTETLTRQLWGMATFLAPPPPEQDRERRDYSCSGGEEDVSDSVSNSRLSSEFGREDGGRFESEISNSSNLEMVIRSKKEQVEEDAIGLTEEVLAFVMEISHHPETWLDFPLSDEEDMDDFNMSDTQWNHAMAIEHLSPRLAALRIELCPAHMTESYFWKVYFVLLHTRLNKHDNELLSTPQIVAARSLWMQELQKRTKPESDWSPRNPAVSKERTYLQQDNNNPTSSESPSKNRSFGSSTFDPTIPNSTLTNFETKKHTVLSSENEIVDKSVIREEYIAGACPSFKVPIQESDDDGDAWLQDNSDLEGDIGTTFFVANDEDVSFSDLEADDDCTMPLKSKTNFSTSANKL